MKITRTFLLPLLLTSCIAAASEIVPAGVIGNSGIEGGTLIRAGAAETEGGVYLDSALSVWFSGGDRIINATFDGRLIRSYPLEPACKGIWGHYFAALDGVLYFGGRGSKLTDGPMPSWGALFALPMKPDGAVELVCGLDGVQGPDTTVICPVPVGNELLIGRQLPENGKTGAGVFSLNPATKEFRPFTIFPGQPATPGVPSVCVKSIAFDPTRKAVYVGGYFGKRTIARLHSPNVHEFIQFDLQGREQWRRDTLYLATSVDPRGWLCFAGGAAWVTAWHGHIARMDRNLDAAPGIVASWNFELNTPRQVIGLRDGGARGLFPPVSGTVASAYDPLVIGTSRPFAYFARWNRAESRLELVQRIGSLPSVASVNISPDGWVSVGMEPSDHSWWRWDDGPGAPPGFANLGVGRSTGAFDSRRRLCSLTSSNKGTEWSVGTFTAAVGVRSADVYPVDLVPFRAGGFGVRQGTRVLGSGVNARELKVATAYASNRDDKAIWRCPMNVNTWKVEAKDQWAKMPTADDVALADPGELAMLEGSVIAVADTGGIVFLREAEEKLEFIARLDTWGDAPDQSFGKEIRIAADGPDLVVADTERHRILWFDAESRKLNGQLGETDTPGDALGLFNRPTCLGLCGERLAVFDSGNQRVVKALLIR